MSADNNNTAGLALVAAVAGASAPAAAPDLVNTASADGASSTAAVPVGASNGRNSAAASSVAAAPVAVPAPAPTRTYGNRNRKKSRKAERLHEAKQEKKERVEQRKRDDARRAQNKSATAASKAKAKAKTKSQSRNARRNSAPANAAKKDGSNNNNNQRRASTGTAARRVSIDSQTLPQTPPKETNKKRPAECSPPVTSPGDDTAGVSQYKLAGSRKGASASTALHHQFDEEDSSMELELDEIGNKKEKTTEKEEESGGGNGEKMDILDVLSEDNPPIVVQLNLHNLSSRKAVKFCSENHLLLNRERYNKNESRPKEFPTDIHYNDVDFSGKIFPTLKDIVVDNSDFEPVEYNGSIFFHRNKGLPDSHEYFDAYDPKIMDFKRGEPLVPIQTRQDWKAAVIDSGHTKNDGDGDIESIGINLPFKPGKIGKQPSSTAVTLKTMVMVTSNPLELICW